MLINSEKQEEIQDQEEHKEKKEEPGVLPIEAKLIHLIHKELKTIMESEDSSDRYISAEIVEILSGVVNNILINSLGGKYQDLRIN